MNLPDKASMPPWWSTGRKATNAELVHWLSVTAEANRDWWLDRISESTDRAAFCWEADHEGEIDRLRHALTAARERIAWLERAYPAAVAGRG